MSKKAIILSLFIGLLTTLVIYSKTTNVSLTQLSQRVSKLLEVCEPLEYSQSLDGGWPLRSKNQQTKLKGVCDDKLRRSSPVQQITGQPLENWKIILVTWQFYVNWSAWSLLSLVIVSLIYKTRAHTRH